jgi:hypothetical protein
MTMRNKILLCFIAILLSVGCVSVTNKPTGDVYFSNSTCNAPCLLGITPGVTSEGEAKSVIKNSTDFQNCHEFDNTNQGGVHWIKCDVIVMVLKDGKISQIGFNSTGLTLEEVIKKYGEPDALNIFLVNLPDYPARTSAALYYDKKQAQINLMESDGEDYDIYPEMSATSVTYLSQEEYGQLKKIAMDSWNGYGRYKATFP